MAFINAHDVITETGVRQVITGKQRDRRRFRTQHYPVIDTGKIELFFADLKDQTGAVHDRFTEFDQSEISVKVHLRADKTVKTHAFFLYHSMDFPCALVFEDQRNCCRHGPGQFNIPHISWDNGAIFVSIEVHKIADRIVIGNSAASRVTS